MLEHANRPLRFLDARSSSRFSTKKGKLFSDNEARPTRDTALTLWSTENNLFRRIRADYTVVVIRPNKTKDTSSENLCPHMHASRCENPLHKQRTYSPRFTYASNERTPVVPRKTFAKNRGFIPTTSEIGPRGVKVAGVA